MLFSAKETNSVPGAFPETLFVQDNRPARLHRNCHPVYLALTGLLWEASDTLAQIVNELFLDGFVAGLGDLDPGPVYDQVVIVHALHMTHIYQV